MRWDNRVNNANIRDTTALGRCILALTQPLREAYVRVRPPPPFFLSSFEPHTASHLQHHLEYLVRRHLMADVAV